MLLFADDKPDKPVRIPSKLQRPRPERMSSAASSSGESTTSSPISCSPAPSLPPAYASVAQIPTFTSGQSQPVNLFYVTETWPTIVGTWTVDPGLNIPEALLPDIKRKHKEARLNNFHIYSRNSQVNVVLHLTSQVPMKSFLHAESKFSSVAVDIASRLNQAFCLTASCRNRDVTVYLPRDFRGPITFQYQRSPPQVSEELGKKLTVFGRDKKQGTAFIGDFSSFGEGKRGKDGRFEHWGGDELIVTAQYGKARIAYSDEPRDETRALWRESLGY